MSAPDDVRDEVRAWLAQNWSSTRPDDEWRAALADSGWAAPMWPAQWYGRGLSQELRAVVLEEFDRAGAGGAGQDVMSLWGNVIQVHGTDEQKRRFLRPLLTGEHLGCLLYSEPGAGSDLASLQTRADRDEGAAGDWVVNGQKVWTSRAREATHALLIARTDWDVPKHRGITLFYFPMHQPGVEVRPIRQVTGGAEFNEVFLDDARVADDHRLGEVNNGWRVLQTALGFERLIMGDDAAVEAVAADSGSADSESAERTAEQVRAYREAPWTRQIGGADYIALAHDVGMNTDPVTRQEIAHLHTLEQVNRWNALRARAASGDDSAAALPSLGKLAMSRIVHTGVRVTTGLLGAESVLDGDASERAGEVNRSAFAAYVTSIGGGTDQVQRNIIGERLLGLPKEPEVDRDVPFRDVRKAGLGKRAE